ncbi:signal peptidase I [Prosthecobacter debontii]|uniref:Signal peptidase I n=1 Tax=Prosthecobacter debontii TaxID=48467 RepID=A0A1T4YYC1_9BACT|nr:signal peptidase I [Prosthecobacter debontii]SKB06764.1 signal peptidase I [Prosthecobacter debontii]
MFFLTPRYLKHAKLLHKGVSRFINYKRDLLPAAKLQEIEGLRLELEQAMKRRDREALTALNEKINRVCEKALPEAAPSEIADNVEVFFVAIVIALGIRGYITQPFQIPTGSMQPTLNGRTAEATEEDPRPGLLGYLGTFLTSTRHIYAVSDYSGRLRQKDPVTEHQFLIFMPYSRLHFEDGHTIKIMAPMRQLTEELGLAANLRAPKIVTGNETPDMKQTSTIGGGIYVQKGQLLASGIVHNGDHVLVDKVSYHFRTPKRGEVFVFTTKHIRGIEDQSSFDPRWGSQHYIKRLAGVPGDTLDVKSPKLLINGQEAQEQGFQKVMQGTYENPVDGYRGYSDPRMFAGLGITHIELKDEQYFAMGDNSYNSSDSRSWGHVPERNLVGPALFCYWPLTKHWGTIK